MNARPEDLGVDGLEVAFASSNAGFEAAKDAARGLLASGARLAVVTCGSLGSFATDGKESASTGIRSVDLVDTTGAGDSFIAGFLSGRTRGLSLAECLTLGRDLAARTCTHVGGFPQEPLPL